MPKPRRVSRAQEILQAAQNADMDSRVQRLFGRLAELRQTLEDKLARVPPESFQAGVLPELLSALDAGIVRYSEAFTTLMVEGQGQVAEQGVASVDAILAEVGVDVSIPHIPPLLLGSLDEATLMLVRRVTKDIRATLQLTIQQGVLGIDAPYETMQKIRAFLETERAAGIHGAAWRSEAIMRTELGRLQDTVAHTRLQEASADVSGLQKEWRHLSVLNPRSGHLAANGQRRAVNEPFEVAPEVGQPLQALQYPRGPGASAANAVFCRCHVRPWLPEWEEIP